MSWDPTVPNMRPFWIAIVITLGLGVGGCWRPTSPSDQADAGKTLQVVLDVWKGGGKLDDLAQRTPPIHVSDEDWMSGFRLQGYHVEGDGRLLGSDVNYKVALELKSAAGKVVRRNVVYAVTTRPQYLVLRQENL